MRDIDGTSAGRCEISFLESIHQRLVIRLRARYAVQPVTEHRADVIITQSADSNPGGRRGLTQLADEVHSAVVAAVGRIQVNQELDVQARHLPLQDVGDGLPLILLMLPLSAGDVGTAEDDTDDVQHASFYKHILLQRVSC